MPTNLHVMPAMIRKVHDAKQPGTPAVTVWGTGSLGESSCTLMTSPRRCFTYLSGKVPDTINVGVGEDVTIRELSELVVTTIGYTGTLDWDTSGSVIVGDQPRSPRRDTSRSFRGVPSGLDGISTTYKADAPLRGGRP